MPGLEDTYVHALSAHPPCPDRCRYHWALIVGPKTEDEDSKGARFHAKEKIRLVGAGPMPESVWEYEERESSMMPTSMLLVRVMIGKVKDTNRLKSLLRSIPIRSGVEGWNCVTWVKEAFETAQRDKRVLGTPNSVYWDSIRNTAMWYVEQKKADHRFDGRGAFDQTKAATWDMIDGRERVP